MLSWESGDEGHGANVLTDGPAEETSNVSPESVKGDEEVGGGVQQARSSASRDFMKGERGATGRTSEDVETFRTWSRGREGAALPVVNVVMADGTGTGTATGTGAGRFMESASAHRLVSVSVGRKLRLDMLRRAAASTADRGSLPKTTAVKVEST